MSAIGQVTESIVSAYSTNSTSKTNKTSSYGDSIGDVTLSEKAAKYYEELKEKYSDMDFVLVADDSVDGAEAAASQYANSGRTQVLINVSKIEEMAEDEETRDKYETIISNASEQLDSLKDTLGSLIGDVKTYGIQVDDDGNTSFYAVVDESLAKQKERIEEKAEEKKAAKKEAEKDAAEEAAEAKRSEAAEEKKAASSGKLTTITATTVEELKQKLLENSYASRGDQILTEQEKQVGTTIDYKL